MVLKAPALRNIFRVRAGIRAPRMTIVGVVLFRKHHEGDLFRQRPFNFFHKACTVVSLKKNETQLKQNLARHSYLSVEIKNFEIEKQNQNQSYLIISTLLSFAVFSYLSGDLSESKHVETFVLDVKPRNFPIWKFFLKRFSINGHISLTCSLFLFGRKISASKLNSI